MKASRTRTRKLLLLGAALVAVVLALVFLPVQEAIESVKGLGPWGPVALGAIYVLCCVLFVPGTIPTLAAGALFGVWVGSITVSIASTLGATLAMLIGRYLARDWVGRLVKDNARFAAVDRAVAKQGFKIVLLMRLSPVFPFNLLNFAFGLTRVSVRDFVLASWIGMLPATVMYVYIGSVTGQVVADGERQTTPAEWALRGAGLLATIAVTVLVTRIARRALAQAAPRAA